MSTRSTKKPNAETIPAAAAAGIIVNGHYAPPPADKDGKIWIRTSAKVQSDPASLYTLWRDVERAPEWQEQIAEVRKTGERTSHWVMRSGDDTIEWDSEIINDEPSKRVAWRRVALAHLIPRPCRTQEGVAYGLVSGILLHHRAMKL